MFIFFNFALFETIIDKYNIYIRFSIFTYFKQVDIFFIHFWTNFGIGFILFSSQEYRKHIIRLI